MMKPNALLLLAGLATLTACDGNTPTSSSPDPQPSELDARYACEETDFALLLPLVGPEVTDGQLPPLTAERYIVHSTQLLVRPGAEDEALARSIAVIDDAMQIDGFVAMSAAKSDACGFMRTYGIWESDEAMFALLATASHEEAVARSSAMSFSAKTASWEATAEEAAAFDWDTARARLEPEAPSSLY